MSDLFHKQVPLGFIKKVFDVMEQAPQHQFQVLTKRADRLEELAGRLPWPDNVWMGATVENTETAWRIDCLRNVPANVRFLSLEPLLSSLPNLDLSGIGWVIVGGESGPGARPMEEAWVLDIKRQCRESKTLFFFKQWGGTNKKKTGRLLRGRLYDEMPSVARRMPGQ